MSGGVQLRASTPDFETANEILFCIIYIFPFFKLIFFPFPTFIPARILPESSNNLGRFGVKIGWIRPITHKYTVDWRVITGSWWGWGVRGASKRRDGLAFPPSLYLLKLPWLLDKPLRVNESNCLSLSYLLWISLLCMIWIMVFRTFYSYG